MKTKLYALLTVTMVTLILGCGSESPNSPHRTAHSNSSSDSSGSDSTDSLPPSAVDIWRAASSGDLVVVKQYITSGRDINARQDGGSTPLNAACVYGRTEVAIALLDAGADADIKNKEGTSALFNAAFFSHPEIVEAILKKGADVNTTDKNGTPLPAIMEAPWEAELEGIHKFVYGLVGVPFDAEQVRSNRPKIAKMLRGSANDTSGNGLTPDSASATPTTSATKTVRMGRMAPVTAGDWATYNCNSAGWRFNQHESILSPENIGQLELKWRFPPQGSDTKVGVIHATPSVVDGYVYFGTSTYGAVYCLSPNGKVVWKYDVGDAGRQAYRKYAETRGLSPQDGVYTSALVTDDSVYFADVAGIMYCLERETGKEVWQVNSKARSFPGAHPANLVMASPIPADGNVVFGGGGYEHAQPAADRNYKCCSGRGFVIALDPQSGDVVWKYDVGPPPEEFDSPLVMEDEYGKHVFHNGPSTSSVWCTPSWDEESNTVFFGTDTHNAPRSPTKNDPRNYTPHSCAVIAVDAKNGAERWVSQISPGDVWNHSMPAYDTKTKRYKDLSIGDTPKVYTIEVDGKQTPVVGAGCKNGGFYVLHRATGKLLAHTPVYTDPPSSNPTTDPRMLALPGPIGGLQTGCATDGERVFTNGIDRLPHAPLDYLKPNPPTGGRVTAISADTKNEFWRHERPKLEWIGGTKEKPGFRNCGDPIASGIAVANGLIFCTTFSSNKLLCINAKTGDLMKDFPLGPVLCGPSVSRGQVYVGTGNTQFSNTPGEAYFPKKFTGELLVFGLPDLNEE